jgi:hypothetical protein
MVPPARRPFNSQPAAPSTTSRSKESSLLAASSIDEDETDRLTTGSDGGDDEAVALQVSRTELRCGAMSTVSPPASDRMGVRDSQEIKEHAKNLRSPDAAVASASAVFFVKSFWYKSPGVCAKLVSRYIKNGVAGALIRIASDDELETDLVETLLLAVNTMVFCATDSQTTQLMELGLRGLLEVTLISTCAFCRCGALQLLINLLTVEALRDQLLKAHILDLACEVQKP